VQAIIAAEAGLQVAATVAIAAAAIRNFMCLSQGGAIAAFDTINFHPFGS
jgi:hypothetical protein